MRSQSESQVLAAVIKHSMRKEDFLVQTSNIYLITQTSLKPDISWEFLRIPEMFIYGMRIVGFPELQKKTYDNWISINNQPCLLTQFLTNPQITLISEKESERILNDYNHRWSIIYTLTRPGLSLDFSQALIQITAHCPAGPPQCGDLLYLEKTGEQWAVKSSYGLYNQ
ncbi:MAG: hypothetical protein RMY62_000480 [Nostoc sp. ZfuVER08]|jgi:hypothetical protein|uniref:Uncharacterized protein n=1 Tax=Nostoc punctiforme FACHB-252 TaxID=1357509 RepID=A0ABR8H9S3_NOSPU|nr:hypothetical protein [Nostoc punctiforme]MBD2612409.1 hypothetical protein [Nostoc punctiforme FACHB-252]MBL1198846.1 hypothetical protein [Nostoc sp. GBBB01]MDZ8010845.1 hypothetical protein [Nostoc sp. ZfuVER08]